MKRKGIFILSILFSLFLFAAEQCFSQFQNMRFDYLTVDNGLSSNRVRCLLRDSYGYLWIGTEMGLNRFDGTKVTIYESRETDKRSLSDNYISTIFEDQQRNLWVGTSKGLNRFNRKKEEFDRYYSSAYDTLTISNNVITSITEDKTGFLWIATEYGLNKWEQEKQHFRRYYPSVSKRDSLENVVFDIDVDINNKIWLVTAGANIWSFEQKTQQFKGYSDSSLAIPVLERQVVADSSGVIWIGTYGNGLFSFDSKSCKFQHYRTDRKGTNGINVKDLFLEDSHHILIAVDHGGICRLNTQTNEFEHCIVDRKNDSGLNSEGLYAIYKDKENILYAGTLVGGVNIYNPKKERFKTYSHNAANPNSLIYNVVFKFFEDSEGLIWIGTDGGGVSVFNPKIKNFINYQHDPSNPNSISANAVLCIGEDNNHDIWLGTWGGGLNRFDREAKRFYHYLPNPKDPKAIKSENIFELHVDSYNRLWISYLNIGVDVFDKKLGVIKSYRSKENDLKSLPSAEISQIRMMNDRKLGFITTKGFCTYDSISDSFQRIEALDKIDLIDVYRDKTGNLWVATREQGLWIIWKNGQIEKHNKTNGFPSNTICGIIEDNQGNIWISSFAGLIEYFVQSKEMRYFNSSDGLQGKSFTLFSSLKDRNGALYFGGYNGLNVIEPNNLNNNDFIPPVYIDEFQIFNEPVYVNSPNSPLKQSILETMELELTHKQSVISFGFNAVNFTFPEKARYAYQMEGYDEKWNNTDASRRIATYTNLDAGEYTFKVIATNNDGVWSKNAASIRITILPPWYKTWWAYLIYAILVILIFVYFWRSALNREKARSQIALERIEFEKNQELAQKTIELDEMKLRFFTNISHEFRTPLTLIMGPLEDLISNELLSRYSNKFSMMLRNTQRLLRLINQLMDMSKLEIGKMQLSVAENNLCEFINSIANSFSVLAEKRNIEFKIIHHSEIPRAWFDSDKVEKIIYNLLSNAFKFTPENGSISVETEYMEKYIQIKVQDSGIGIAQEHLEYIFDRFYQVSQSSQLQHQTGTGIGLSLIKNLIELHHGFVSVQSAENQGTTFLLKIPIVKEEYSDHELSIQPDEPLIVGSEYIYQPEANELFTILPEINSSKDDSASKEFLILLVEDNDDLRLYLKDIFANNYRIVEASDGEQGLQMAHSCFPDIVISDVMMPKMDGIEFCNRLKTDENISHIPVILLTAYSSNEYQIKGYETGADEYITKPFNSELLIVRVKNLLESRLRLKNKFLKSVSFLPSEIAPTNADEKWLERIKDIIDKSLPDENFNAEMLCNEIKMSRTNLYRKIRALTNQSVHEFIRNIRLKKAAQLLLQKELPIKEIVYHIGYNNVSNFSRDFKSLFGITPAKFTDEDLQKMIRRS